MKERNGIIALITVILVSLFLFSLITVLSIQGDTAIISGQLGTQADRAEYLARAGLEDATIKIARIKNYSGSYTLIETDGTVDVRISTSSPTQFQINVTSTVTQANATVKWGLHAEVTLDSNGKITILSTTNQ